MSYSEAYTMGWQADLSSQGGVCPPWAASLSWDHQGIWVVVKLTDLERSVPGLKVFAPTNRTARILIRAAPKTTNLLPQFFTQLENAGLPVIAFNADLELVSEGGVLTRSEEGHTHLSAEFYLESTPLGGNFPLRFLLPRRMHLTGAPGSATAGGGPELVPPFRVPARVTADSEEVFLRSEPHGLDEAEFEADVPVFLNSFEDDQDRVSSGLQLRPHTTTPSKQRRPSLVKRIRGTITRVLSQPLALPPAPPGRVVGGTGGVPPRPAVPAPAATTATGTAG